MTGVQTCALPISGPSRDDDVDAIRAALKVERKMRIDYADGAGKKTTRVIWPVALAFFEEARVLIAWCELRVGFRHFRVDRMSRLTVLDERPPKRRRMLMQDWRISQKIPHFTEQGPE